MMQPFTINNNNGKQDKSLWKESLLSDFHYMKKKILIPDQEEKKAGAI